MINSMAVSFSSKERFCGAVDMEEIRTRPHNSGLTIQAARNFLA